MASYTCSTENKNEMLRWLKASCAYSVIWDLRTKLRNDIKNELVKDKALEYASELAGFLHESLDTYGVDIFLD